MKIQWFFVLSVILLMAITPMFAETVSPVDPGLSTIVSFNAVPVVESTLTVQAAGVIQSEFTMIKVLQVTVTSLLITVLVVGIMAIMITLPGLGINPWKKRGDLALAGFV